MKPFTFGSLFSGVGGIDLGLERAGMQCAWQVEIDDYATKVLEKQWPNVTRFRDVRTVGKRNLPTVDLLAGGFPCQPHSLNGKRKASEDERDLWPEFRRLICELKPAWVLAENVMGLLSSENGHFFGGILRDLAALRYDAQWQVLPASSFGAPHRRERVFIVAYPQSLYVEKSQMVQSQKRPPFQFGRISSNDLSRNQWKTNQPSFSGMDDGIPYWVDRSKGLGNAVVPQIAESIAYRILMADAASKDETEVA
jgi:DNA (cytosine-5)-methyltransferase 1